MRNEAVFQHLDSCNGSSPPPRQVSFGYANWIFESLATGLTEIPYSSLQPMSPLKPKPTANKPPERLPAINYSILKEGVLRKKMKDLGIPSWGPRPLLQKRHTEWMNLWNANCDSKFPKSKLELVRELDAWERIQGGHANPSSFETTNTVMGKTFDATAWSTSHGDDFKRLIANARKKSDAVHRPVPQESTPSDELEKTSIPEQSVQNPTETGHIPEAEGPLVNPSVVNGVENQTQQTQNGVMNTPPDLP